jgi:cytochrome d ubiquinol oxidase subunit II
MDYNLIWFVLLGVLLAGYAILDGFDLGVGMLHLLGKSDTERRIFVNAIGPIWDGNEVWLVTFGGALFAMFPDAYATVFSGFYNAFMLVLFGLIFRAVSLEFRSKMKHARWRAAWDLGFFLSSTIATLVFGVAIGNAMIGVPLTVQGTYAGTFLGLFTPYTLAVGLLAIAMFLMHGSIYLYLKTEGDLQARIHAWIWRAFFAFLVLYALVTAMTLLWIPRATRFFQANPWAWIVVLLNVLAIANIPRGVYRRKPLQAFISSCCTIAAFVFLLGLALFPNLVTAVDNPQAGSVAAHALTIYNAASSQKTLGIGLLIVIVGFPFVLAYTAGIYWVFRGKVQLEEHSY